jgi:hypothetical protein
VKHHPKNVVAALLRAIEAKDKLLACYRLNGRPSESLFKALDKADQAVSEARAWLMGQEQQPQDGAK